MKPAAPTHITDRNERRRDESSRRGSRSDPQPHDSPPAEGAADSCRSADSQHPDPGTPLQAQASHAAAAAGQPRVWAPTPLASHGHASAGAPSLPPRPQQPQGHPPMPAAGRSGGRRPASQIRLASPPIRPSQRAD
jgi:hypothetical protein